MAFGSGRRLFAVLALFFSLAPAAGFHAWAAGGPAFYFFDPDSPQSNLTLLKKGMDAFLSDAGLPIRFQPFAHPSDLERRLREDPPAFLLVPGWYSEGEGRPQGYRPLLVSERNGATSYRKILLTAKGAGAIGSKGRSLALTYLGPKGPAFLNEILFAPRGLDARDFRLVTVPKDSDALVALVLGQVDAALVVRESFQAIAKVNPRLVVSVEPLWETKDIPMPVLWYRPGAVPPGQVQRFSDLFLGRNPKGRNLGIMKAMNIDDWRKVAD